MSKTDPSSESVSQPIAVSIRTAQVITGLGRSSIYELLAQKRLVARHYGRRVLVLKSSIDNFLASLPEAKFKVPSRGRGRAKPSEAVS